MNFSTLFDRKLSYSNDEQQSCFQSSFVNRMVYSCEFQKGGRKVVAGADRGQLVQWDLNALMEQQQDQFGAVNAGPMTPCPSAVVNVFENENDCVKTVAVMAENRVACGGPSYSSLAVVQLADDSSEEGGQGPQVSSHQFQSPCNQMMVRTGSSGQQLLCAGPLGVSLVDFGNGGGVGKVTAHWTTDSAATCLAPMHQHEFAVGQKGNGKISIFDVRTKGKSACEIFLNQQTTAGCRTDDVCSLDSDGDWLLVGATGMGIHQFHVSKTVTATHYHRLSSTSGAAGGAPSSNAAAQQPADAGAPSPSKRRKQDASIVQDQNSTSNSNKDDNLVDISIAKRQRVNCVKYTAEGLFVAGDFPFVRSYSRNFEDAASLSLESHRSFDLTFTEDQSALVVSGARPLLDVFLAPFARKSFSLSL